MTFMDNFYLSEDISLDRKEIIRRIKKQKKCLSLYLISISDIKDGMLDIIPAMELKMWPKNYKDELRVIGVADGLSEANELISQIALDVFQENGNYDLKSYFINKI